MVENRDNLVLVVTHSEMYSGAEKDMLAVVDTLSGDYAFEIVCPTADGSLFDHVRDSGVPYHRLSVPSWVYGGAPPLRFDWWRDFARFQHEFRELVRTRRPSAILCNSVKAVLLVGVQALRADIPVILHQHDILRLTRTNRVMMRLLRLIISHSIAVSGAVGRNLMDLGVSPQHVTVVYNFLYGRWTRRCHRDATVVRRELGETEDQLLILSAGQLTEWKGVDLIIDALAMLRSHGVRAKLLVAGAAQGAQGAEYEARLRSSVVALGLDPYVRFLGFRNDVDCLLSAADVYVHGARRPDPFPLVILEALASGICVVASNSGGVPEIVTDGVNGSLYQSGSVNDLSAKLLAAVSDRQLRQRLGEAGKKTVMIDFDGIENRSRLKAVIAGAADRRSPTISDPGR